MSDEIEKLKKENKVKSDLISISAHQLRTSLSAFKWMLKMFADHDLGPLSAEQEGFINKAITSNDRMIHLVNDLLTANHSEDTTVPFKFEKMNITNLIDETIFEFYGEAHKKNIELIFIKNNDIYINCDPQMIRVVIENLIENALKYTNEQGKVFVSIKDKGEEIEISVRDNGIGIKDSDKDLIFNKFFRTDEAIKKDSMGSGLGLFTSKDIVDRHNGKLYFENNIDSPGTTFFIILPKGK